MMSCTYQVDACANFDLIRRAPEGFDNVLLIIQKVVMGYLTHSEM